MKIFISWSGTQSRQVAEALNDWLRRVIQAVKPFYSAEIEKGAKWSNEIDVALEGTSFGIICLTPENLNSPWIHFEAGALSKTPGALIWTFLTGLSAADVPPPLGRFQHTLASKEDTLKLVKTINRRLSDAGGDPLTDRLLEENFDLFWPQLEKKITQAINGLRQGSQQESEESRVIRDERAVLNEILELARNQERHLVTLEARTVTETSRVVPAPAEGPRWDFFVVRIDAAEGVNAAREFGATISDILPESEVTIESIDGAETTIRVEFPQPVSEKRILTAKRLAAYKIGISEPGYALGHRR